MFHFDYNPIKYFFCYVDTKTENTAIDYLEENNAHP